MVKLKMTEQTKTICPNCKAESVKKRGFRHTGNRGNIQRYECKKCHHAFVKDDGFYRMRNAPQKITCAIDLFYRGVSTRKVQEHFKAFYPHNADHSSILMWIRKYSKMISQFTDTLKLNVGSEIQVDEVEYHRRKSHKQKRGICKNWFIDSVCPETKFIVASNYFQERSQKNIKIIMKSIKSKTGEQVKTITTDSFNAYENAVKKTFGYDKHNRKYYVFHNKVNASKGEGFNHPIERLHNNIRARTKTFRGFHGSAESANAIMKGLAVYHNFITEHQAIGKCPYELATDLKLNGENKWMELIQLSKKQ